MTALIFIVLMLLVMWFLLIRPQRRRQLAQSEMLENLAVGDEIVTAGGLYGHVRGFDEDELRVEIAPGTHVRVAKRAVAAVVPPEDELEEGDELAELEPGPETEQATGADASPPERRS